MNRKTHVSPTTYRLKNIEKNISKLHLKLALSLEGNCPTHEACQFNLTLISCVACGSTYMA
jgi:hypothetical protein